MSNRTLYTLAIGLLLLLPSGILSASAQKKKSPAKAKTAVKAANNIDVSQYTDNPICRVMILDSTVVEKDKLLDNLILPSSLGRIFIDDNTGENAYENEFGNQRLIAKADASGHHNIYSQTLLGNTWSEPEAITINGSFVDIVNPFMSPDGQTLFFAARSSLDKAGTNLSLYMTTYDPSTQSYLTPQQLPYPFLSASDDLYYIEDDADSLAWFVSSRRQMDGYVCIYTMRIHEPWQYYDSDELSPAQLKGLACLESMAATWPSTEEYNKEKERLNALSKEIKEASAKDNGKIYFIGANDRVFTSLADFSSDASRKKYKQLVALEEDIKTQERQLEEFRRLYHNSMEDSREAVVSLILDAEKKLTSDRNTAKRLTNEIRKAEH